MAPTPALFDPNFAGFGSDPVRSELKYAQVIKFCTEKVIRSLQNQKLAF